MSMAILDAVPQELKENPGKLKADAKVRISKQSGRSVTDINKVLRNCIDFCEFPHRCYTDGKNSQIIWKTLSELQEHAMYECPKFGCDICY